MIEDTEGEGIGSDLRLGKEIIATMEGALCVVRANDSTIIYANPSFEKMFGYDAGEIIGKQVATLIAPRHKTSESIQYDIGRELRAYGRWRGEMLNRRKEKCGSRCTKTLARANGPNTLSENRPLSWN